MITLFVPGTARPGGSKTSFIHPKTGKKIYIDDAKGNGSWKKEVKKHARLTYKGSPLTGALLARVTFVMERPAYHYGTGRNAGILKPKYAAMNPHYHTTRPDSTKLFRSTEDALTGIIWVDDGQVMQEVRKIYGDEPGVHITIEALE